MSLVIHVEEILASGAARAYPFEVDKSYYFDTVGEVQDFLDSGQAVLGMRLWLDRPMPSNFYDLDPPDPELNVPDRVRVVIGDKQWVVDPRRHPRVTPWVTGRIIRFED